MSVDAPTPSHAPFTTPHELSSFIASGPSQLISTGMTALTTLISLIVYKTAVSSIPKNDCLEIIHAIIYLNRVPAE